MTAMLDALASHQGASAARVRIRRVRLDDAAGLTRFYGELSAESRRRRFLGFPPVGPGVASAMCGPDHRHAEGFVAELVGGPADGTIVGHLCLEAADGGAEEVALAVADAQRREGIGRRLLGAGILWARHRGVSRLIATAFGDNTPVLRLFQSVAPTATMRAVPGGVVEIEVPLESLRAAEAGPPRAPSAREPPATQPRSQKMEAEAVGVPRTVLKAPLMLAHQGRDMHSDTVVRARQGDQAAFASLAGAMGRRFHDIAYRILQDAALAQDATQQAIVDVWRNLPQLRDPERFDAWSYRVLVRVCHAEARRKRRRLAEIVPLSPLEPSSTDELAAVANREQLERGFRRLSVDQRATVVLRYYLDLEPEAVAESLGVPVGTVHSRLHRAMRSLRAALDADSRAHPSAVARSEVAR